MRLIIAVAISATLAACSAEPKQPSEAPSTSSHARGVPVTAAVIDELNPPAQTGAAEPFLSATRDGVLLSWLEPIPGTDRVALRFSRYAAQQWTAPRTIIERNDLFVNWADFPSLVQDAQGTLFAHWLQKSGKGTYSYDVRMSTSEDGGATWREPFLLNRDGKEAEHGFVTLAVLPDGGVAATWLDGRAMSGGQGHDGGGDMSLRYATVDRQGTIDNDVQLDARTCECCTTGMTLTASGPVIVYRDRSPDEVRDIARVAKTPAGWSTPALVNADSWKIAACPVNGPQIDSIGTHVVTGWFTAANEQPRAFVSFSDDAGQTFDKAIRIDDGKPIGRLDVVLLDERTALVTWLEQSAAGAEIRARRIRRDGTVDPAMKIADSSTARASGFARITRLGNEVYFTWTEQNADGKRVHVARGRVS